MRGYCPPVPSRRIDVVIAPALGGIVVAQEVGRQLGVRTLFAERKDGTMQLRRGFDIRPGERVLVCEDVVTTGGSVQEVLAIVRRWEGWSPGSRVSWTGVAARCGLTVHPNAHHAVLTMKATTHQPAACPLCAAGNACGETRKPGKSLRGCDGTLRRTRERLSGPYHRSVGR